MASAIRTAEQLERAGDIGPCELVRGELVMMMPPGGRHGQLAARIAHELTAYGAGTVLVEAGFVLSRDPDTVRAPDLAFVRRGRAIGDGFLEGAPDLAVEVVSPGDRPGYVAEKAAEWLEAGAAAVWVVDPHACTVVVHEPARKPRILQEADALAGGPVLPGFALDLARLFAG